MGVAAGEREAASDGHAAGREHAGLGQTHALAIAVEAAGDADALGMVAPEAGMNAVHLLEPVDETRLAEATRREPAAHIGEASAMARTPAPIAASLTSAPLSLRDGSR